MSPTPAHAPAGHPPPRLPNHSHIAMCATCPKSEMKSPQNSLPSPTPDPALSDAPPTHESAIRAATPPAPHQTFLPDTAPPPATPPPPHPPAGHSPVTPTLLSTHTLCSATARQTTSDTTASVSHFPQTHAPHIPRRSSASSDECPLPPTKQTTAPPAGNSCSSQPRSL